MTFVQLHGHTFGVAPLLAAIGEPVSTLLRPLEPRAIGQGDG
jgi:hypothetical protein